MSKKIFIIDGLGALLSAILLLIIVQFEPFFGISKHLAYFLIPIPLFFSLYSFLSFFFGNEKWRLLLKGIAIANLLYGVLTLYIVLTHHKTITNIGISYFFSEMLILVILAVIELRIATQTLQKR